ncbi:MAG: DUF3883 domain-containing protein [Verrucomicrobiota bacterium]
MLNPVETMLLNPQRIATREKLILAGLFLSKYDSIGVRKLGFQSFIEAYNVIGYALGGRPAAIKNYRDEFDPHFPNRRKGWHKRPTRDYCLKVFNEYKGLDLKTFTSLVKSFVGYDENALSVEETKGESGAAFAKRLFTGFAAEHYFEAIQPRLPEFKGYEVENTTRLGCGYDFRLRREMDTNVLAVEVKGLTERTGSLSLTPKEHEVAGDLGNRFFLFVVKNFCKSPFHEIYQNPLSGPLRFAKKERVVLHVSWITNV